MKRHRFSKPENKVEVVVKVVVNEELEQMDQAAKIIQRAWKRWLDIGVFEYYKQLIGFKQCGEPWRLMRCIDPREAELLDSAAGVHIRFRLGGLKFPPSIYYKIFTHRPIVDMCANSPKDYAKLAAKPERSRESPKETRVDYSGWYKRIENNGWRLICRRFWKELDVITAEDNVKPRQFYYSKVQKKHLMEKRRKRKKIEWMQKMYYGEFLQVKTHDPSATLLIQRAAEGLITALEKDDIDKVMEWEVNEMLNWTNALNYEEYIKQWKELGTSKSSDNYQGFNFTEQQFPCAALVQVSEEFQKMALQSGKNRQSVPRNTPYN